MFVKTGFWVQHLKMYPTNVQTEPYNTVILYYLLFFGPQLYRLFQKGHQRSFFYIIYIFFVLNKVV